MGYVNDRKFGKIALIIIGINFRENLYCSFIVTVGTAAATDAREAS